MKGALWGCLLLVIVALVVHDVWLARNPNDTTYTTDIRRISSRWPIVPAVVGLFVGFLFCHFFWWDRQPPFRHAKSADTTLNRQ